MNQADASLLVREVITSVLPTVSPADIREDQHLRDLGADSVDRIEIVTTLMHRFGIDEPMSSFSGIPCVGALIDYLRERSRPDDH
jgi:polyketide biosynthesis acyl carrier protein